MKIKDPITTNEAASILGVTRRHVRHLIAEGHLPAERVEESRGPTFVLSRKAVQSYERKPSGRRPKAAS